MKLVYSYLTFLSLYLKPDVDSPWLPLSVTHPETCIREPGTQLELLSRPPLFQKLENTTLQIKYLKKMFKKKFLRKSNLLRNQIILGPFQGVV